MNFLKQVNRVAPNISWRKLFLEAVVLVISVYVAIALENISDQRARHNGAVQALRTLRAELALDRENLGVVLAAQRDRDDRHRRVGRWLDNVSTVPVDSMSADLRALFSVNRTMFPRSASWTTMVSSGQLIDLGNPELVSRLADFYENKNRRLEYNGALYDEWVTDLARSAIPLVWEQGAGRLLATERTDIARLRGSLAGLHDITSGFIGLLEEWSSALDALINDVDAYLRSEGVDA